MATPNPDGAVVVRRSIHHRSTTEWWLSYCEVALRWRSLHLCSRSQCDYTSSGRNDVCIKIKLDPFGLTAFADDFDRAIHSRNGRTKLRSTPRLPVESPHGHEDPHTHGVEMDDPKLTTIPVKSPALELFAGSQAIPLRHSHWIRPRMRSM